MNASEILQKAKNSISVPDNWIQGCFAQDYYGGQVSMSNPNACKFCSYGALAFYDNGEEETWEIAHQYLNRAMSGNIVEFNDSPNTTHGLVMAAFDRAIISVQKDGK